MRIKEIVMFFLMAITILTLAACAGVSTSEVEPSKKNTEKTVSNDVTTIKFLYIWPEHSAVMEKTIQQFEEAHPNIKVDVSVTPWDKVLSQLQTSIAADDAPDVSFMWPDQMSSFVTTNTALDLTPYLDDDPEWKERFLSENLLKPGTYDDKVYNIPFRGSATYIAYNINMFEKYGWSEPKTIEELESLMDKMLSEGITPFAISGNPDGFQIAAINNNFINYNLMAEGILDDPKYIKARKVDIQGPYENAFKKSKEWYEKGYYGKSPIAVAREQAQALFFQEQSAMIMLNNNELSQMREGIKDKFEMKYMIFPKPADAKEQIVNGNLDGWMVYGKSKHIDESIELLKYLSSAEAQSLWGKDALSVMTVKNVEYDDPALEYFASLIGNAGKYNQFPDYNRGDISTRNNQAFVNYLQDDSYSAKDLEETWNNNIKQQIEDSE